MRGQRKEEDIFIIYKSSLRTSLEVGKFTMNPHVRLLVGRLVCQESYTSNALVFTLALVLTLASASISQNNSTDKTDTDA